MKRIILPLLLALLSSGACKCIDIGRGQSVGYVTTVQDALYMSNVWFRADVTSSQTDCYLVANDEGFKAKLQAAADGNERVKITFRRFVTATSTCSNDLVIAVEPAKVQP